MAVGPILTLGYGSFGSVSKVVTLGYVPGEAVDVGPTSGGWRAAERKTLFRTEARTTLFQTEDRD